MAPVAEPVALTLRMPTFTSTRSEMARPRAVLGRRNARSARDEVMVMNDRRPVLKKRLCMMSEVRCIWAVYHMERGGGGVRRGGEKGGDEEERGKGGDLGGG